MSPDLEGRRVHVVMGCRVLARAKTLLRRPKRDEPIMIANNSKPSSQRATALGRVGSGKPHPCNLCITGFCLLQRYLGYTRLDP